MSQAPGERLRAKLVVTHNAAAGRLRPATSDSWPAATAAQPAQGTSTESSVGESRATTYSAGSASERFWRRWVSRGGT